MSYIANYAPVTSELASAGIVLIPIALLFVLIFTTRVIFAAAAALLVFLIIAAECYHMPWSMALIAACNGFLYVRAPLDRAGSGARGTHVAGNAMEAVLGWRGEGTRD